jgi:cytochrome c oxidase subunit IV
MYVRIIIIIIIIITIGCDSSLKVAAMVHLTWERVCAFIRDAESYVNIKSY